MVIVLIIHAHKVISTCIKAIHHEIVAFGRGNVRDSFLTFLFDLEGNWQRNEGMGELPFCWVNSHYFVQC